MFVSRFGDELLKREVSISLLEAKVLVEEYRNHYNHERLHSALNYQTPTEFATLCEPTDADEELMKKLESTTTLSSRLVQRTEACHLAFLPKRPALR